MRATSTMADVARLAGVSAMTVSRALRRDGSVSERTRARVLQVVDEIGYVPDQSAQVLSSGRSGLVAALVPTLAMPIYGRMAQGLSDTLFAAGLQLFLGASEFDAGREQGLLLGMLKRRPEALVLCDLDDTDRIFRLAAGVDVPVIQFLGDGRPAVGHIVEIDPVSLGRKTAAYLAESGRPRIAVAIGHEGDARGERRLGGLVDAARELGLPDPVALRVGEPRRAIEQGALAAEMLAQTRAPVDVLVLMTDGAAIGAMTAFREAGLRVPQDVAVFGFGDCDVASHVTPPLTTIGFDALGAGVEIGKILISALAAGRFGTSCPPYRLALDFDVVRRTSA